MIRMLLLTWTFSLVIVGIRCTLVFQCTNTCVCSIHSAVCFDTADLDFERPVFRHIKSVKFIGGLCSEMEFFKRRIKTSISIVIPAACELTTLTALKGKKHAFTLSTEGLTTLETLSAAETTRSTLPEYNNAAAEGNKLSQWVEESGSVTSEGPTTLELTPSIEVSSPSSSSSSTLMTTVHSQGQGHMTSARLVYAGNALSKTVNVKDGVTEVSTTSAIVTVASTRDKSPVTLQSYMLLTDTPNSTTASEQLSTYSDLQVSSMRAQENDTVTRQRGLKSVAQPWSVNSNIVTL